jgi:hypothetical protein
MLGSHWVGNIARMNLAITPSKPGLLLIGIASVVGIIGCKSPRKAEQTAQHSQETSPHGSHDLKAPASFVWPSWLPEYPGWSHGTYIQDTVWTSINGRSYYRNVDAIQRDDRGQFRFYALGIDPPVTLPYSGDVWVLDRRIRMQILSFYDQKAKALGMDVKPESDQRDGLVGLVASDSKRGLIIRCRGPVSPDKLNLGVAVNVAYAPCASVHQQRGAVVNPQNADEAAQVPCHN